LKIINTRSLAIADIKTITFSRFVDHRGYFTEHYRDSDFRNIETFSKLNNHFVQSNESYSRKNTVRGLHFQWNPYMGKLVRTVHGHMIDMILDIRIGSPYFGKIILYDMPCEYKDGMGEWIWIPPGFAHGNIFLKDTIIEYFCTGEYSPGNEAGISPLSSDIDWTLCDEKLEKIFFKIVNNNPLMTEKDRNGYSVNDWKNSQYSKYFKYSLTK